MPRIPPRKTPEWRHYWAVRSHVEDEAYRLKTRRKWVESWPDSERKTEFLLALQLQEQALTHMEAGHAHPYMAQERPATDPSKGDQG